MSIPFPVILNTILKIFLIKREGMLAVCVVDLTAGWGNEQLSAVVLAPKRTVVALGEDSEIKGHKHKNNNNNG
ncbi:hypothetical protein SNOG_08804 [Parastagonospora nodorum SN15]|uniref:Uncharacterized protein n=1 Tax=Phaeosphaeria nodorum (strain SN15 / ATCC MYA-4574 / FGSC 10173) TaxID=321614 RepID=Q0UHG0_PHANO|nr:hypothetical protein SNOG_08804 [Parastagonospora nodorum SN15]EAT83972.1 hypothetical protein SNOG_08804 [Parastagonospora nodorum SN15]